MGFFITKILLFLFLVGSAYLGYAFLFKIDNTEDDNDDDINF